jgi:hypothetical protein
MHLTLKGNREEDSNIIQKKTEGGERDKSTFIFGYYNKYQSYKGHLGIILYAEMEGTIILLGMVHDRLGMYKTSDQICMADRGIESIYYKAILASNTSCVVI